MPKLSKSARRFKTALAEQGHEIDVVALSDSTRTAQDDVMKPLSLLLTLMLAGAVSGDDSLPAIDDLAWLTGCWAADGAELGNTEQWMAPAGGSMLGMARVVRDGRMVAYEFTRIVTTDDGLVFIASPSGQETAEFALKQLRDKIVTFENPDHDFPQRIIYRMVDSNNLQGRIEGVTSDGEAHIEFPLSRIACDKS